jgi:hypothetical protein
VLLVVMEVMEALKYSLISLQHPHVCQPKAHPAWALRYETFQPQATTPKVDGCHFQPDAMWENYAVTGAYHLRMLSSFGLVVIWFLLPRF